MGNIRKDNIIEPKKGGKKILSLFFIVFFLVIILSFLLLFWSWQGIYLPKNSSSEQERLFTVEKGQNLFQVAVELEEEGLIKNKFLFGLYIGFKGNQEKLQAGNYLLSSSMTIPEIADKIVSGDIAKDTITIIEGWNLNDIARYLEERGLSTAAQFLEITNPPFDDFIAEYGFLKDKPEGLNLEGYIFPDTYCFLKQEENGKEMTVQILRRALDNFEKKLSQDLKEEIKSQKKTIFEIITMASLLEKEVRTLEDKKMVAGVLWKRLQNNIPLQVDATISYITGKKSTKVSIEETKIDSPYNTYKYRGLPLGPICNPGLDSIISAVYPENSSYWYYLSTPEGETIFSRTLDEHNTAKNKYLK